MVWAHKAPSDPGGAFVRSGGVVWAMEPAIFYLQNQFITSICVVKSVPPFVQRVTFSALRSEHINACSMGRKSDHRLQMNMPVRVMLIMSMVVAIAWQSHAQSALPKAMNDSLWAVWNDARQADTNRLKAMHRIAWDGYIYSQPDSAYHFAQMQYDLAMKRGLRKYAAMALQTQGGSFYVRGDYEKALERYERCLSIREELGNKKDIATMLVNIGLIYKEQGNYAKAIDHYMRGLKLFEEMDYKPGMTASLNNIGIIYNDQKEYRKAIDHYSRSLRIQQETGNKQGMAGTLNNIGMVYEVQGDNAKAITYYTRSLTLMEELGDKLGAAYCLTNIGIIYFGQGNLDKSMEYQDRGLAIKKEMGDKVGIATSLINIGDIYLKKGLHAKAIAHGTEALQIAQEIGAVRQVEHAATVLYSSYKAIGQSSKALEMYELYNVMRDSITSETNQREVLRQQMQYDYDKKEALLAAEQDKKDAIATEQLRRREIYLAAAAAITFLLGIMSLMAFFAYRAKSRVNVILEKKNHLIEDQKKEITDSIRYAENIQRALLPHADVLQAVFPDSFILHRPKDIVSGDFYWIHDLPDRVYFAVVDCTGHGVPGAFMSFIGTSALNRAVTDLQLVRPSDILTSLSAQVSEMLHSGQGGEVKDGMDLALCCYFKQRQELHYAGAYNPLWVVRNGEMQVIKADKQPVGNQSSLRPFTDHVMTVSSGDTVYLFSDGFADQFGGTDDKKIGSGKFRSTLQAMQHMSAEHQGEALATFFDTWKGQAEQVDDVCVMGVRF